MAYITRITPAYAAQNGVKNILPLHERLTKRRDFAHVYGRKKSLGSPLFVLYVRRYDTNSVQAETRRMGFVVSKKAAKRAHDRNKVKRRMREIARLRGNVWRRGWDGVWVVRTDAVHAPYADLEKAMVHLVKRAGLLMMETAAETAQGVSQGTSKP